MNSDNLQRIFPEIYEEFFTMNNLIISCPQIINRGNVTHSKEVLRKIAQKLPTKLYIGINLRKNDSINVQSYIEFNNQEQCFIKRDLDILQNTKMIDTLKGEIKRKLKEKGVSQGIDIMILSENQMGTGTAIESIQMIAFTIATMILGGKINLESLENLINSEEYGDINEQVKEGISIITGMEKDEVNDDILFTAAVNNRSIGLAFPNKEYLKRYSDNNKFENKMTAENFPTNKEEIFDFSIINFGHAFGEFYNHDLYINLQKQYHDLQERYKIKKTNINVFTECINFHYAKIINTERKVISNPTNNQTIELYFESINNLSIEQTHTETHNGPLKHIQIEFNNQMVHEDEILGAIPISSAKQGGTFLCITKHSESRITIKKTIEALRNKGYPTVNAQYLSREDGISHDPIRIEQYLDHGIVSSYAKNNDTIIETIGLRKKEKNRVIGKHRELLNEAHDMLLFDTIDGKIYINNEIMNHKTILTQSGTVEIMRILCEHAEKYVNNTKLPISSYSKNKNEMVGKIIVPLQEMVQKRFGERLNLECTGNIIDFDMRLMPSSITIGLIKRIIH